MSSDKRMDKEAVDIYKMDYNSVIKSYEFESVKLRWVNLEPEQSEVSQKEKNKYHLLTYMYGI